MMLAWLSSSEIIASSLVVIVSKSPPLASKQLLYKIVSSVPKKLEIGSRNTARFIRTVENKGNNLQIKIKLELPIDEVTLDKYRILEQIQRKLADPAERNIILTWR